MTTTTKSARGSQRLHAPTSACRTKSACSSPRLPATPAAESNAQHLHDLMLADGYSPDEIEKILSALHCVNLCAQLRATYLAAGYSPDEIAAIISLYE